MKTLVQRIESGGGHSTDGAAKESPANHPVDNQRVSHQKSTSHLRGAKVLVVDDHEDSAELLAEVLMEKGCEIQIAYDGESALALARTFRPSATLLDLGLPDVDGYDVARQLRADPSQAGMKIIAITGYGLKSDREKTRDTSFDAYLVKPFDMAELLKLLT